MTQETNKYTIQINEEQRRIIQHALSDTKYALGVGMSDNNKTDEEEIDLLEGMFTYLPNDYDQDTIYDMCDEGPTVAGWTNLREEQKRAS